MAKKKKSKKKEMKWYVHKGVSRKDKKLHQHPSHPYPHPRGRRHKSPPTSRIKDRKGRKFRQTPQEKRRTHVKKPYTTRGGKRKRWD